MNIKKIIVISPSGNFYGSEQVLFDYLDQTSLSGLVYVPNGSVFFQKLVERNHNNFQIIGFNRNSIAFLYLQIAIKLATEHYSAVYLNEAGHIRYFGLLKLLFPIKSFVIHVRLIEDTVRNRWWSIYKHRLKPVSISKFIQHLLPVPSLMIYDPFKFTKLKNSSKSFKYDSRFNVGIIGRVTATKGSFRLPAIIEELAALGELENFHFHLFGDICPDFKEARLVKSLNETGAVSFHGFVSDPSLIYSDTHAVLHLSEKEPLGRIFLEALNEEIPFIGFNGGGIGEMASMLRMNDMVVNVSDNDSIAQLVEKLLFVKNNINEIKLRLIDFKEEASHIFDPVNYSEKLDSYF